MQWPKSDVYACRVTCAFCVCRTTTELQTPSLSHSLSSGGGDSCRSAHLVTCTRIPVWILCVHASADSCVLRLSLESRPCLHCDIDIDASMIDSAAFAHMPPWRGLWAYWISPDAAGPNTASTTTAAVTLGRVLESGRASNLTPLPLLRFFTVSLWDVAGYGGYGRYCEIQRDTARYSRM